MTVRAYTSTVPISTETIVNIVFGITGTFIGIAAIAINVKGKNGNGSLPASGRDGTHGKSLNLEMLA